MRPRYAGTCETLATIVRTRRPDARSVSRPATRGCICASASHAATSAAATTRRTRTRRSTTAPRAIRRSVRSSPESGGGTAIRTTSSSSSGRTERAGRGSRGLGSRCSRDEPDADHRAAALACDRRERRRGVTERPDEPRSALRADALPARRAADLIRVEGGASRVDVGEPWPLLPTHAQRGPALK